MRQLGFIGLGTMGAPMALNLLKHGCEVTVAASSAAAARLVAAGARTAPSPQAIAAASECIITMLPEPADVEAVVTRPDGIAAGIRRDAVYIDMSTIDPATTRRVGAVIAGRGAHMVDCPVGKTAEHAVEGTLTLMAGGPEDVVARVRPVLAAMGTDFFYCGPLGSGVTIKLINNLLVASIHAANVEALVAGVAAGLEPELMLSVFRTTMAWNNSLANGMPKRGLVGNFEPGFKLKLGLKDVRLAVAMSARRGMKTPVADATVATLTECLAAGYGENDLAAMLKLREQAAGVEVRLKK
jgi:3-hydroxyisobutyrate dehydrogenase-like beta-hydroxyacid dehydrogenase